MERSKKEQMIVQYLGRRRSKLKDKYLVKHNAVFDQLDLVTYEEVSQILISHDLDLEHVPTQGCKLPAYKRNSGAARGPWCGEETHQE